MASVPVVTVTQNDNNITLIFNIKKDNQVESLLGARVYFQLMDKKSGNTLLRECVITDPSNAEVKYILTNEDLSQVGIYQTELQVEYPNTTRLTKQNPLVVNVMPEVVL